MIENAFRRDLKLYRKRGANLERLDAIVQNLRLSEPLPASYRAHKLHGQWQGVWDCHIFSDLLLIYKFDETTVTLLRRGSHSDLF